MKLYVGLIASAKGVDDRAARMILDNTATPTTADEMKAIERQCEQRIRDMLRDRYLDNLACVIVFMHQLER